MTIRRAAVWILRLEWSANQTEYLVHVRTNGTVELEESPALAELLPPEQGGHEIDLRAALAEDVLEDERRNVPELLCDYTRKVKLPRRVLKQILRARRRGYHRDHSKLPHGHPWRGASMDPLAGTIDKALEELFWRDWVEFLDIRPMRRTDLTIPQSKRPPKNSELNFPSGAGSPKRF
jgi:hypothetical protein